MKTDPHYLLIADFYGDRVAKRSGVLLMNHIDEGLLILNDIRADEVTRQAWCLHPMLQADEHYMRFEGRVNDWGVRTKPRDISYRAVMLAMEYRAIANAYLSTCHIESPGSIRLGPDPRISDMLVADKVQNRKDFEKYNLKDHPRSVELQIYFKLWLARLGISEEGYNRLCWVSSPKPSGLPQPKKTWDINATGTAEEVAEAIKAANIPGVTVMVSEE